VLTDSLLVLLLVILFILSLRQGWRPVDRSHHGRRKLALAPTHFPRTPRKPPWVKHEVLKLKALMPQAGCRAIAQVCNRRHGGRGMTIGKTYAHGSVRGAPGDRRPYRDPIPPRNH